MKVFVNGTFDLLHRGHIELLNYAKSLGEYVCVGIDTDDRVRQMKGHTRPIHNQEERKFFLENLKAVDEVRFFSNDAELEGLVKSFKPDIMVVGSDWKEKSVIGSYWAAELIFFDRIGDYATTKTIEDIINRG
jgi:D-beta-D-heptose 7-phosphate kinase/D-beta-D-heptose 1-phosphate adenosyltransferase